MREHMIQQIPNEKVIAIVRGIYGESCLKLARALHKGGVRLMEVTFDQTSERERLRTVETIQLLCHELEEDMYFGAGTVTTVEMVRMAKQAGARYIISPDTNADVIHATREEGLVSIPGALTPTEISYAHSCGADFVKLFPASAMGAKYLKDVTAPLRHIRILAVGGVNGSNIGDYLNAGAVGAGVAGCLFKKEWVEAGDWAQIMAATAAFMKQAKPGRGE